MKSDYLIRPVVGFEDSYIVTSGGQVFSKTRYISTTSKKGNPCKRFSRGRWLKINSPKYSFVGVGQHRNRFVHRLVAEAFLDKPPSTHIQVNHKNGIKTDNRVENLEWCTAKENINHAVRTGLNPLPNGENHSQSKLKNNEVSQIRELYSTHKYSQRKLATMFGVSQATINSLLSGYTWRHI